MENKKEKWIIDTDPGCDDLFAILYLLRKHDAEVLLVSVANGNVHIKEVEVNVKKSLVICDINPYPETLIGVSPITANPIYTEAYHFEGGFGNIKEINELDVSNIVFDSKSSCVKIVELVNKYPNEINLLAIAPCSTITTAYMLDSSIAFKFKYVYTMGGSLRSRGNVSPTSEFNYAFDPIASHILIRNFANVVFVPWEPTELITIGIEDLEELKKEILSEGKTLNEISYFYLHKIVEKFKLRGNEALHICDFYTIAAFFNHKVVKSFFIGEINVIFDSIETKGAIKVEKVHKHEFKDFTDALNNISKIPKNSVIVVEEIDRENMLKEMKLIFIK